MVEWGTDQPFDEESFKNPLTLPELVSRIHRFLPEVDAWLLYLFLKKNSQPPYTEESVSYWLHRIEEQLYF